MKKNICYSTGAKIIVAIIYMAAVVLMSVSGSYIFLGNVVGMTVRETVMPVPYLETDAVVDYVYKMGVMESNYYANAEKYMVNGVLDTNATIDITQADAGVNTKDKDMFYSYSLGDLIAFRESASYDQLKALISFIDEQEYVDLRTDYYNGVLDETENKIIMEPDSLDRYYSNNGIDRYSLEGSSNINNTFGDDDSSAPSEEILAVHTENFQANDSYVVTSEGNVLGKVAAPLFTHTIYTHNDEGYESAWEITCYENEFNTLYNNYGYIEAEALYNELGFTLAEFALSNHETVSLLDSYKYLLRAADAVYNWSNTSETETNIMFYAENLLSGDVYTNVNSWKMLKTAEVIERYSGEYSKEGLYYLYDYDNGASTNAPEVTNATIKEQGSNIYDTYWKNKADGHYNMVIALNTNFPIRDVSPSPEIYEWYYSNGIAWPFLLTAMIVAAFMLFVMVIQTGRGKIARDENGKKIYYAAPIDKFPIEVMILIDVILWSAVVASTMFSINEYAVHNVSVASMERYIYEIMGRMIPTSIGGFALLAWMVKRYTRRIKMRKLGGSIVAGLVASAKKALNAAYRSGTANDRMAMVFVPVFALITVISIAVGFAAGSRHYLAGILGLLALAAFSVFVFYRQLKNNAEKELIMKALKEIGGGDLDFQIDTTDFSQNNMETAEMINKIKDGLQNSIKTEMKSEKLKTDLITNVSHDIKTPLTSIINYVDILKRMNIDDEKAREYIDILARKSLRLKQLTDDLVEVSKISSGVIQLNLMDLDMAQLVLQTNGEFEDKFEAANLEVFCTLPDKPMLINADGQRLFRILENLYNNASKYAMPGTRIYINGEVNEDNVVLSMKNVSKNKLNITADELMERFVRGDSSRNTEGSGLGLEIARSLTTRMNGKFEIYLDGDLYKVTLTFPLVKKEG